MDCFGLILPAGVALVSLLQIVIFVIVVLILPGTLVALALNNFGINKRTGQKTQLDRRRLLIKIIGVVLYHLAMFSIWIISWPQFTNDVHSGYAISVGLLYYLGVMILWTATGLLLIYGWHLLQNQRPRRPGVGFFVRLYLWNLLIMFIFRNIIYRYIT